MAEPSAEDHVRDYESAKASRSPHESDWRNASAYCLPAHYGMWMTDGAGVMNVNGVQMARRVVFDTTGIRSLPKYMAILERLATPNGSKWMKYTADNPLLMRSNRVRQYFDELTNLGFKMRYAPRAMFRAATNETYAGMGVYGMGPLYLAQRKPNALSRAPGLAYRPCMMKDIFVLVNANGEIDKVFRRYYLNVRQYRSSDEFRGKPLPAAMAAEGGKVNPDDNRKFEFVHVVYPRVDYEPDAFNSRRFSFGSRHICVEQKEFCGDDNGYRSMPYLTPRTFTVAGDPYGHSPAVAALAALGGASTMKKTNLKLGNMAADPVLLTYDDGVLNGGRIDLRPGHANPGGVNKDGRKLIQTLETGNYIIAEKLLEDERRDIEDSFFVTLFQILQETPEMTATEVIERVAEKAALLSPTMGRLQAEFLGPMVEREIDVFDEMGILPKMPPELVEAQGEYKVEYTSPLAKGEYAEEVSGFMRSVEFALGIAQQTQDPSALDPFNFDVAIPEIADRLATPARWMHDEDAIEAKREGRSQAAQQQQLLEQAPAIASTLKTAADMQGAKQ